MPNTENAQRTLHASLRDESFHTIPSNNPNSNIERAVRQGREPVDLLKQLTRLLFARPSAEFSRRPSYGSFVVQVELDSATSSCHWREHHNAAL